MPHLLRRRVRAALALGVRCTSFNNALSYRLAGTFKGVTRAMNKEASTASQSLGGRAAEGEGLCRSKLWDAESARRYVTCVRRMRQ